MRNLKFRFSYKHIDNKNIKQIYLTLDELNFSLVNYNLDCFFLLPRKEYEWIGVSLNTGKLSHNNTPIYTGDIVRHINYEVISFLSFEEVKYDDENNLLPFIEYTYKHYNGMSYQTTTTHLVPEDFKIMGDRYRNPELLKEK